MKRKQNSDSVTQKDSTMTMTTAYLILYNFIQCLGWTSVALNIVLHFIVEESHRGVYTSVATKLNIFQLAALLEIVHATFGLVKSNPVLTGVQVISRVMLLLVAHSVKEVQNCVGIPMLLMAWTITEVIRYAFYMFGLVGNMPYLVQWCRYTFFIILYPVGVSGELITIYMSLPMLQKTSMYSVAMPNAANFAFNFHYFMIATMISYIPFFPPLYMHMLRQRRKVIGGVRSKQE
ncbi:Very-long-chain (3R)-3-hydroxyacyl-CoA dehydratase 2 [Lamellibrachia satsuma]|nr:Very-long-chain (3R)-3-hydroxyacyl-CoA dehydratase 2 [Lamellibrachia satsuma]